MVVAPALGAPYAAMVLEKLIALGARRVLALGWCGSLSPRVHIGDLILPDQAVPGDGTSPHYCRGSGRDSRPPSPFRPAGCRSRLCPSHLAHGPGVVYRRLLPGDRGPGATLPGPGIIGIDLELAALFAVSRFRGMAAAGLLVVSDELFTLKWQPARGSEPFRRPAIKLCGWCWMPRQKPRWIMSEGALLAVDVGGGTQDIFLWEPGQAVENAVKMVLPAPTQIMARRLRRLTEAGRAVFLTGRLMGGGPIDLGGAPASGSRSAGLRLPPSRPRLFITILT